MRRLTLVAVIGMMFATVLAVPALADAPFTFSDSSTFEDVNPCSGEVDEITINFEVSIHEHRNNFVVTVGRSGSTDSGYTMIGGTETYVENRGGVHDAFVDQWRHPDGSKFMVHGIIGYNANQDEVKVEKFGLTCIGNGSQ